MTPGTAGAALPAAGLLFQGAAGVAGAPAAGAGGVVSRGNPRWRCPGAVAPPYAATRCARADGHKRQRCSHFLCGKPAQAAPPCRCRQGWPDGVLAGGRMAAGGLRLAFCSRFFSGIVCFSTKTRCSSGRAGVPGRGLCGCVALRKHHWHKPCKIIFYSARKEHACGQPLCAAFPFWGERLEALAGLVGKRLCKGLSWRICCIK